MAIIGSSEELETPEHTNYLPPKLKAPSPVLDTEYEQSEYLKNHNKMDVKP